MLVACIFGSSWHLMNGPTNALSLVIFSTLIGFGVRFDAAKAGTPSGKPSPKAARNLSAVGLGSSSLPCSSAE